MTKRKRILVVDDEEHNRDLLEAMLKSFGYDSTLARNGNEALTMIAPTIDLVLLDVMMPGIDGFEVARQIRDSQEYRDTPIIMVTALAGKQDRISAVEAGANDFITKPIDKVELRVRMESLLKMKEAQDAIKKHRAELEATVKKRTAALQESEERMRLLIESSPIGIMIVQHRHCSYANPSLAKMFGYDGPDGVYGKPIEAMCAPESRGSLGNSIQSVLDGNGEVHGLEIECRRHNGHEFEVAAWLTSTEYREAPALLVFLIDISEQKALRAQLLRAQKMEALGTLAGGIAHDFNNILFAVMGYCELAMEAIAEDSRPYADLQRVLQAAERAKSMVKQILTFSRQTEQEKKPIQITPIVKEALKFLRASIPSTIEIRASIQSDLGMILADPTQIHQVLMNLCTNAAHSMRDKGGVLEIRIESVESNLGIPMAHLELNPGPHLKLTVSDTGHGMTPQVLERIFEPYYTTKKPEEGTGLGLAMVHGIITGQGGDIAVKSELGKGSTFEAYFPITEMPSELERPVGEPIPQGTERLLLVDDEKELTLMNKRALEKLGYRVVAVTKSPAALELFRSDPEHFDLIITDLTMPHMTGLDLATEVKEIRNSIPVILCTGYSELVTEEEVTSAGIQALLTKPVSRTTMAGTIRQVLDGSE